MMDLTNGSKALGGLIGAGAVLVGSYWLVAGSAAPATSSTPRASVETQTLTAKPSPGTARSTPSGVRPVRIALANWPGHMPLVIANGGLKTAPGSAAAAQGLDLEISFIDDPGAKNKGLQTGELDFIWHTVDELPISLGSHQQAGTELRVFLQLDWSSGGDACVAAPEVRTAEDIIGRHSAMMLFSPDHTLFEFMLTNSLLDSSEIRRVRSDTRFSAEDVTFGRTLFTEGKVDVACLWEPDVSLALAGRAGAHRLFSTSQATELIADILVASKALLESRPQLAEKLMRVWFDGVEQADGDHAAAARAIMAASPRFRDELGYERTLQSLRWVKWSKLADNVRFFGLDGEAPAFDRAYNQADSIWVNYPEAAITSRFVPAMLRHDHVVRQVWTASGRPVRAPSEAYDPLVASQGTAVFTKSIPIPFAAGSSTLGLAGLAAINREILPQAEIARQMSLRIEGNSDDSGDPSANQALSEKRAKAILDYLVGKGVARGRLSARGNGARNPVASNDTPEGRSRNRRTDVRFIARRRP